MKTKQRMLVALLVSVVTVEGGTGLAADRGEVVLVGENFADLSPWAGPRRHSPLK